MIKLWHSKNNTVENLSTMDGQDIKINSYESHQVYGKFLPITIQYGCFSNFRTFTQCIQRDYEERLQDSYSYSEKGMLNLKKKTHTHKNQKVVFAWELYVSVIYRVDPRLPGLLIAVAYSHHL